MGFLLLLGISRESIARVLFVYMGQSCVRIFFTSISKLQCCKKTDLDNDDARGNVHLITTIASWEEKISESIKDHKIVLANFSANWCTPCKRIAPFYSAIAHKYPSLICLTVDVDQLPEFSSSWGIKATPTFFFLKDGRQVDKLIGADKEELKKKAAAISSLLKRSPT
ncbi:thioredoxin H-type [Mangifera indica]|uniref:thioredoxin H-type n=1 Tax=Mangifera indica TaxID=29780 RepID=UPI001CF98CE8|nr:thioredoxin H-type [Mangifera indica]